MSENGSWGLKSLPVFKGGATDLKVTADGSPAWPLLDPSMEARLRALCRDRGVAVVEEGVGDGAHFGPAGTVYGIGDSATVAARLYAHLTGRHVSIVAHMQDLPESWGPDVVVVAATAASAGLLNKLYPQNAQEWAPGLLFASPEALTTDVALAAAAARLRGNFQRKYSELYPLTNFESRTLAEGSIVSGKTVPSADLGTPAEVLVLQSHGDGVDAPAGNSSVLCAMVERAATDVNDAHKPYCVESGTCHRFNTPIEAILLGKRVLPIHTARGRVFLFAVCHGLVPDHSFVSTQWSLFRRIPRENWSAIITSWALIVFDNDAYLRLCEGLYSGKPIGQLVASYNSAASEGRLCVVGEPLTVVDDASSRLRQGQYLLPGQTLRPSSSPDRPSKTIASEVSGDHLQFLRMWLSSRAAVDGDRAAAAQRAGQRLATGEPLRDDDLWELLKPVFWESRRLFSVDWMLFREHVQRMPGRPCPNCRTLCDTSISTFRGAPPRRLSICSTCGIVEDSSVSNELKLSLSSDSSFEIRGQLRDAAHALITIGGRGTAVSAILSLPAGQVSYSHRPEEVPRGPLHLQLFVLAGAEISVLGLMLPSFGDPAERVSPNP